MRFDLKGMIKFLFPEWQILKAIDEHGLIVNRKDKKQSQSNMERSGQVLSDGSVSASSPHVQMNMERASQSGTRKSTGKSYGNMAGYSHKETTKIHGSDLTAVFNSMRHELGRLMIGQNDYLDQLCVAFKRPYVTGFDMIKPKNVMIILGSKGTGKRSSISYMSQLLKEHKLVSSGDLLTLDLSLYTTVSEFGLFLSDLYKALYAPSNIVLFENFDKCHSSVIDVIH